MDTPTTSPEPESLLRAQADRALALMDTHDVAATPDNFQVWFAYVGGAHRELVQAINGVLNRRMRFDAALNRALHLRFFGQDHALANWEQIGERLGGELDSVLTRVRAATSETRTYGNALSGVSAAFAQGVGTQELPAIVEALVLATRQMEMRTRDLETKLESSANEVRLLRTSLDAVRREAETDPLTALHNRKSFDEKLAAAAAEAEQNGEGLSLLFGDVDHFKRFNDNWGHQFGDQVLRLVADCLKDNIKGRDVAARYGGEEFAIILPQTSLRHALSLADQIRRAVETRKIVRKSTGEELGRVTISFGVAEFQLGETLETLIDRADAALYSAKRLGRNRVVSEESLLEQRAAS